MKMGEGIYERLADLLEYPDEGWGASLELCEQCGIKGSPALLQSFIELRSKFESLKLAELQEFYTRGFDLNPACALEVGYHVFGETYKRGLFLAKLGEAEAPFRLGQENQLPDYLPVLLRLIEKLEDEELRGTLIKECLLPAAEKIHGSLSTENPFSELMAALKEALKSETAATQEFCATVV